MARYSAFCGLRCVSCGRRYEPDELWYTCSDCGPLAGTLDVLYDLEWAGSRLTAKTLADRTEPSLWRYHEILPIRDPQMRLPVAVGMTPLVRIPPQIRTRLSAAVTGEVTASARATAVDPTSPGAKAAGPAPMLPSKLWIKDDTRHQSGSAKDRATVVALARAKELGCTTVAAASTGNAASSLATLCAPAGLGCVIFAPASAPEAKLVQIRIHGAQLFAIEGTYDQAFDLCLATCAGSRLYNRNTAINPVLGEGKKTIALEIWEQLGYRAPDVVVVPVGDGCILGGVAKGFRDLLELELIPRLPRLIGAQAEGSAALAGAWRAGQDVCEPVVATTLADSISVSRPRDQVKALRAVRESAGAFVTVSDSAILRAMADLASHLGIFVEPAAAASFAGLRQARSDGLVAEEDEVVFVVTGHGLKDIAAARRAAEWNPPVSVDPASADVQHLIGLMGVPA